MRRWRSRPLRNAVAEGEQFRRRALLAGVGVAGLLLALAAGYGRLQILQRALDDPGAQAGACGGTLEQGGRQAPIDQRQAGGGTVGRQGFAMRPRQHQQAGQQRDPAHEPESSAR